MNISPRKDMEGAKTVISVMAISALTNTLSKGQENGDATKVEASGKLEIVNEQTPVIDTKFEKHMVDSNGRRQLPDGEIMKIDMNKDRRKLQKAIIVEQEEQNKEDEMATVILSLHAKQPKRATIAFDKGYIEIYEYPRGDEATITYTETLKSEKISAGDTAKALEYEIDDMEKAVAGENVDMHLDFTRDVMDIMTFIRKEWGMFYPEEEGKEIIWH